MCSRTVIARYFTPSRFCVNLRPTLHKLPAFLFHPDLQRIRIRPTMCRRIFPNVLSNLHRAEMWAAHGTEVRELRAFLWQGFIVILARDFGVEGKVELIFPAEFETRLRQSVVAILRA